MISERYLWRDSVRTSWRNWDWAGALRAVRRRLMKAVFFFIDESSEPCTGKTSAQEVSIEAGWWHVGRRTLLAIPGSNIELTQLSWCFLASSDASTILDSRFLCLSMVEKAVPQLWRGSGWWHRSAMIRAHGRWE